MPDEPKPFPLLPSRKSSSLGNGNGHKPHFLPSSEITGQEECKVKLKYAFFFLAVAFLLILANWLDRASKVPNLNSGRLPLQGITLVVRPQEHVEGQAGFVAHFRLSNMGNHSVFYAVRPGTNVPVGQIVTRTSPSSEQVTISSTSQQQRSAEQEFIDRSVAWIEMPPGGWVEGQFRDPGWLRGECAYAVELKTEQHAKIVSLVSPPYHCTEN